MAADFGQAGLARTQSLVRLKGYVINVPIPVMPAAQVITKYHDLWHVEKSFRGSKTDLDTRPMFNRVRDAIEAHLTIEFAALAISHAIQSRIGLAIDKVVKQLRPVRSASIIINGATGHEGGDNALLRPATALPPPPNE